MSVCPPYVTVTVCSPNIFLSKVLIMLDNTAVFEFPLPFTMSIVVPLKSNSSPYFTVVGGFFTSILVTLSFTVTLYVVVFVIPFSS